MGWNRFRVFALALGLLTPISFGAPIDINNPPQGTFIDEWLLVEFGGGKVGHAHNTVTREGDRIVSRMVITMAFGRAGQGVKISTSEASTETIAGQALEFDTIMLMGMQTLNQHGDIQDGQVKLLATQSGIESKRTFPYPKDSLMSWGMYRKQMEMGLTPGTKYQISAFVPSQMADTALDTVFEVIGPEPLTLNGESVPAIKVAQTMTVPMAGAMTMTAWVDENGDLLQSEVPLAGMGGIRMVKTDRETALKAADPPEFFMQTLITVPQPIDRLAAKSIRYRLSLKDATLEFPQFPTTGMQTLKPGEGHAMEMVVSRMDHEAMQKREPQPVPSGQDEFLASNALMNLDDPEVRRMADDAAGGETHPYRLADKLRRYVTETITAKTLNVGFGTATEVCRTREGDCSEHAVLLAALGRAKGLPSKVVTGLVYVPGFAGAKDIFGFHMWTQFLINGQWVDFDAAQRESDCNPTHIAVSVSSLGSGSLVEASFALMRILGQLQIDVVEVVK